MDLNHARLPIPPLRRCCSRIYTGFPPGVNDSWSHRSPLILGEGFRGEVDYAFLRIRFWLVLKSKIRQAVPSKTRL